MANAFDKKKLEGIKNPFVVGMKIPVSRRVAKGIFKMNEGTQPGEVKWSPHEQPCEKIEFTRLYATAGVKALIRGLSHKALRLFVHIASEELVRGEDHVVLDPKAYMKMYSITSATTYKMAKKELVDKSFIVGTSYRQVYWINPEIFFKGSRVNKYPDNIEVKYEWY